MFGSSWITRPICQESAGDDLKEMIGPLGTTGAPAFGAYSASKAAVRNLARTWAQDLKGTGIRVNVLSPGPTATELAKAALGAGDS